jgi:CRISPR system Cascade subunit CasA
VLRRDGTQEVLSLREVFAQASQLRRITGDLPTQEFALLRLLLAIAHDALEGPTDTDQWSELWAVEDCFAPVQAYLDEYQARFDLLDPHAPFFQSAGLRTGKDEVFSLNRIVADVPNGDPFFTSRMPTVDRLTFAEAARWVVHAHAFDTSGIKSGVVGDERAKGGKVYPLGVGWAGNLGGVFAEGNTLRETLLLNLVAFDTHELLGNPSDRPAWRRDPCGPGGRQRSPDGLRDLYTWQTRRIRLHYDAGGVHGVVLGYGDPLTPRNRQGVEPMTAWRRSLTQEKKHGQSPIYMPREHDPSRSAWRGVAALIANHAGEASSGQPAPYLRPGVLEWVAKLVTEGELQRGFLMRARVIGAAYGTQQSVIDDVVDDHLSMAVALLHRQDPSWAQQAVGAVSDAEEAVNALGDLATNLARSVGSESDGPRLAARERGFGALEAPYRVWLAHLALSGEPVSERAAWQKEAYQVVSRLGRDLIAAAGERAWQGRTVMAKSGSVWLNSALAESWFRSALARCLGQPQLPAPRSSTEAAAQSQIPEEALS